MPYVVLPAIDAAARRAVAERRWQGLAAAKPEAAASIGLQQRMLAVVLRVTETLESRPPRPLLPPRYLTTKLSAGIPALVREPLPMPLDLLEPALVELSAALADGSTMDAARRLNEALQAGTIDKAALLMLALHREQAAIKSAAARLSLGHDVVWLIADLAASPYAHVLLRGLFDRSTPGSPLGEALDRWTHGYCPLCGSWPALAETNTCGGRHLRCAFCAAAWTRPAGTCTYCDTGASLEAVATSGTDGTRGTLELCASCRGYLKIVEGGAPLPFPLLPLAEFASMEMDIAAMQRGFGRPGTKIFGRR
jgi:FdhE protein